MSDSVMDMFIGVFVAGVGIGVAFLCFSAASWGVGTMELQDCAAKHDVYACHWVAVPSTTHNPEEK